MIVESYHVVNGSKFEPFKLGIECKTQKEVNALRNDLRRKHGSKKIQRGSRFMYEPEIFVNTSEAPEEERVVIVDKDHKPFEPTKRQIEELIRFTTVRSYIRSI